MDAAGNAVATNLFGDITTDSGVNKVFRRYPLPLADHPAAVRVVIRAQAGKKAYRMWTTTLYVDDDADGLDADQELQVGTLYSNADCDDDGLNDYAEVMVTFIYRRSIWWWAKQYRGRVIQPDFQVTTTHKGML